MIEKRYSKGYRITMDDFINQVATIPENTEDENAMGDMMGDDDDEDGRDSDADLADQIRQRQEYENNVMGGGKHGLEESAEEEIVDMKGRYNIGHPMNDEEPTINNGEASGDESPAAGSESHNYLAGLNDENDEDNNQA